MAALIAILVALVLFFAFLALTALERARGKRFFERARSALDVRATRIAQKLATADPFDYVVRATRTLFGHIFHDIAHVLLALVRMLERTLTGVVYRLRHLRKNHERLKTNSEYVKNITAHKESLRAETPGEENQRIG